MGMVEGLLIALAPKYINPCGLSWGLKFIPLDSQVFSVYSFSLGEVIQ